MVGGTGQQWASGTSGLQASDRAPPGGCFPFRRIERTLGSQVSVIQFLVNTELKHFQQSLHVPVPSEARPGGPVFWKTPPVVSHPRATVFPKVWEDWLGLDPHIHDFKANTVQQTGNRGKISQDEGHL
jgi:hypothetical protein